MSEEKFTIICKAVRPSTNSSIKIEIPVDECKTPKEAVDYVGNLFNWQFVPLEFAVVTSEVAKQELEI